MQTESVNNSVVYEPLTGRYKLRFDDDVIHPSYYRFEIEALQQASPHDEVIITVNSNGGNLSTGIEFVNEILSCEASVHGVLRADSHSCGSIVFLACDTHEVGIASEMLLHSGSGHSGGTPAQTVNRANSYKRQVRSLFETVYKGFVTESELNDMIEHDKEFIFSADEIKERLNIMYACRNNDKIKNLIALEEAQFQEEDELIEKGFNRLIKRGKITRKEYEDFKQVEGLLAQLFESGEIYKDEEDTPSKVDTLIDQHENLQVGVKLVEDVNGDPWEVEIDEDDDVTTLIYLEDTLVDVTIKGLIDMGKNEMMVLAKNFGIKVVHNMKPEKMAARINKFFQEA